MAEDSRSKDAKKPAPEAFFRLGLAKTAEDMLADVAEYQQKALSTMPRVNHPTQT